MGSIAKPGHCLVCGSTLEPEKTVWCGDCQTPHHRECFSYAGKCAIYGCGCMRFQVAPGRVRGVNWIEITGDEGVPVPQGYVVDFSSGREGAAKAAMFLSFLWIVFAALPPKHSHGHIPYSPYWMTLGLLIFVAAFVLWLGMDDYRVVDAKTRQIWMHRKFFNTVTNEPEVSFSECDAVVMSYHDYYQKGQKRKWTVYLSLRDGSGIQLLDSQTVSIGFLAGAGDIPEDMKSTVDRVCQILKLKQDARTEWSPGRIR